MSIAELEYALEQLPVEDQLALLDRALEKKALENSANELDAIFRKEEAEKGLSWNFDVVTSGE